MFQAWDSETESARPFQYCLGDRDEVGRPVTQAAAARDAAATINRWLDDKLPRDSYK